MNDHLTRTVGSYFPGKPKRIGKLDIEYKRKIDEKTVEKICQFIKDNTIAPDYWAGVTIGISDGLDSATVATLCIKALGKDKVFGVVKSFGDRKEDYEQERLSIQNAESLGIKYEVFNESKVYRELQALVKDRGPFTDVNIGTRVIQDVIFQVADEKNYAVISTINKSEILTARFMEHFYGHLAPLAGLYKTEIFDLAKIIGIPEEIIARKPGGVDTWYDEDTFGVTYDTLDKMLYLLTEEEMTPSEISQKYNFDQEWIDKLKARTRQRFWRLTTKELHF